VPKRIAICTHMVPFTWGGLEQLASRLKQALEAAGHQVEWLRVPFNFGPPERSVTGALTWRLMDLRDMAGAWLDVALCLAFPSYLVEHPNKVVWLCHQHRAAYDLFGTPAGFQDTEQGRALRETVRRMDTQALGEARYLFSISRNVADRLKRTTGYAAEPLLVPPSFEPPPAPPTYEGFALHVGRLTALKRAHLLLEALAARPRLKMVFAGSGDLEAELKARAAALGVADRAEFAGFVDEARLKDYYRRCSAVAFTPYDEDYGLVVGEAFLCGKPVVTTTDSGGGLELVDDGVNGAVSAPRGDALAAALEPLLSDPERCRSMGEKARARIAEHTWPQVVRKLEQRF
jgi:glycosyltransferase involved in cell wall biosynthesis